VPDAPVSEIIAAGRLGRFWEWRDGYVDMTTPPMYGHLAQRDSHVEVTVAAPDDFDATASRLSDALAARSPVAPDALLGILEHESVLLVGLSRRGPGTRWKRQPLTNTATYTARDVVAHLYGAERLKSPKLRSASVVFPGMPRWAGINSVDQTSDISEDGLIRSARIDLLPLADLPSGRIRPGMSLRADVHWSVNQQVTEQLTVSTGLAVQCRTTEPAPVHDFVRALSHVQLAVVLAYRTWITPEPGWAVLHLKGSARTGERSQFWSGELMTKPRGVRDADATPVSPFVTFEQLGGTRGLARWVRLCEELPRVVEPLRMFHRNGATTVYDHINATCSAIEYWAASWKSRPGWGAVPGAPGGEIGKLYVVAHRVGREWMEFVGDLPRWASLVWDAYLSTKHFRPSARKLSFYERQLLTTSVDLLLTGALLNEAAGSKAPTRGILGHHDVAALGERLRQLVT
jgi:hypothetical protein